MLIQFTFPYREFLPNNVIEDGSEADPIVFTTVVFPLQTQVVAGYNFGPLRITIGNDPTGGRLYQAAESPNNSASININDNFLSSPENFNSKRNRSNYWSTS